MVAEHRPPTVDTHTRLLILATATWGLHVASETLFRAGLATVQARLEPMAVVLVLTAVALVAFTRSGLLAQASIASLIGVLAAANGAVHVYDLTHRRGTPGPLDRGPSLADVLRDVGGVATSIAGIGLLGLGSSWCGEGGSSDGRDPHRCGVGVLVPSRPSRSSSSAWCWSCFPWCSGLSRPIGSSTPRQARSRRVRLRGFRRHGRGGAVRLVPPLAERRRRPPRARREWHP